MNSRKLKPHENYQIYSITITKTTLHCQSQTILSPTNISEGDKLKTSSIVPLSLTHTSELNDCYQHY